MNEYTLTQFNVNICVFIIDKCHESKCFVLPRDLHVPLPGATTGLALPFSTVSSSWRLLERVVRVLAR